MSNIFRGASDKVKQSGMVIPVTLVFITMFIVSCALMWEDYSTSLAGYQALPTRKVNDWVIPMVAMLPQLGQVGFAYVFATDTNRRWAVVIAVLLWTIDVYTDVYYKANGMNAFWQFGATVETITIYSIGSEIMLATSVGILADLLPPFFKQVGNMLKSFLGGGGSGSSRSNSSRPQGGGNTGTKYTGFTPINRAEIDRRHQQNDPFQRTREQR